jgi:transposase-like protein
MSVSLVARQGGVSASLLFQWRKLERQGALTAVSAGEPVVPASELAAARAEISKLQRILGKKTLENEILKEAVELAAEKNVWSASHLQGSFSLTKAVCTNVSGLSRVDCGCSQAMMRSARCVPNKWNGLKHPLFFSGLRCVDQLFRHQFRASQTSERQTGVFGYVAN